MLIKIRDRKTGKIAAEVPIFSKELTMCLRKSNTLTKLGDVH
jgi:hypothetical protein